MTQEQREKAAILVEYVLNDEAWHLTKEKEAALITAISVLRGQGWVKSSERLPTEEDADDDGYVPCLLKGMFTGRMIRIMLYYKKVEARHVRYFHPLPPLPGADQ